MSEAFSRLARYIGVFNTPMNEQVATTGAEPEKVAMTAPVAMKAPSAPEKVAMTAPVAMKSDSSEQSESSSSDVVMSFMLPASKYSRAAEAPKPTEDGVYLVDEPESLTAVHRFSGRTDWHLSQPLLDRFVRELTQVGRTPAQPLRTEMLGYNPPWTLPWLRTNELVVYLNSESVEQSK